MTVTGGDGLQNKKFSNVDPATAAVAVAGISVGGALVKSVLDHKLQERREVRKEQREQARQASSEGSA